MQIHEFDKHIQLEDTHWWFRARRNIILTLMQKYCRCDQSHLVEIGCGTGGNLRAFIHQFKTVVGVDISKEAVQRAHSMGKIEIHNGDFRQILRHKWNNIDIILLADVLEHIQNDTEFLGDIITAMKKNAILVATVPAHPHLWSSHDVALGHFRRYQYKQFRNLWSNSSVLMHFISPFNFFLYPLIALIRLLPFKTSSNNSDLKVHSGFVNSLLYYLFNSEKYWIKRFPFPWGSSYVAVVQKL